MTFEELAPVTFPLANRFFKANGHKGKARGDERVFILRAPGGQIRAALRACPKESGYLLRSVQVDRCLFRQGLGSKLVIKTVEYLQPGICWCYPYIHLQTFYEHCGFEMIEADSSPEDIQQPFIRYQQQGHDFLLMRKRQE